MTTSTVPTYWKKAKFSPIYKSGSTAELENYRLISILLYPSICLFMMPSVLQYLPFIGHGVASALCPRNVLLILPCTFMISSIFLGPDVPLFLFTQSLSY